jgi:hypothetical protein
MKANLLVIGAIIAISVMMVMVPTATGTVNATCAGSGKTVACAGNGAFAQAGNAIALAFKGFAAAFIK